VRIRATCHACERDFLFFQLYNATDQWHADRCPHCNRHLGINGLSRLAVAADRTAANLVAVLTEIADRDRAFTVKPDSVVARIDEITATLAASPAERATQTSPAPPERRMWPRRRAA
jgi:hypothetical protein